MQANAASAAILTSGAWWVVACCSSEVTADFAAGPRLPRVSAAAEQTLGYKKKELLGKRVSRLYSDPKERERLLRRVRRQLTVVDAEVSVRTKDGTTLDVATSMSFLKDDNGEIIGTGKPGPITRQLHRALRRRVGVGDRVPWESSLP